MSNPTPTARSINGHYTRFVRLFGGVVRPATDRLCLAAEVDLPLDGLLDHLLGSLVPAGSGDDIAIVAIRRDSLTSQPQGPAVQQVQQGFLPRGRKQLAGAVGVHLDQVLFHPEPHQVVIDGKRMLPRI